MPPCGRGGGYRLPRRCRRLTRGAAFSTPAPRSATSAPISRGGRDQDRPLSCADDSIRRQVHLIEKCREPSIAAQGPQERVILRVPQADVARAAAALQPLERAVTISPPGKDLRHLVRRWILQANEASSASRASTGRPRSCWASASPSRWIH